MTINWLVAAYKKSEKHFSDEQTKVIVSMWAF